jgi:hypothetical protein
LGTSPLALETILSATCCASTLVLKAAFACNLRTAVYRTFEGVCCWQRLLTCVLDQTDALNFQCLLISRKQFQVAEEHMQLKRVGTYHRTCISYLREIW